MSPAMSFVSLNPPSLHSRSRMVFRRGLSSDKVGRVRERRSLCEVDVGIGENTEGAEGICLWQAYRENHCARGEALGGMARLAALPKMWPPATEGGGGVAHVVAWRSRCRWRISVPSHTSHTSHTPTPQPLKMPTQKPTFYNGRRIECRWFFS